MNLKGESDYFAIFKIKARDSAPQNVSLHHKQKRQSNRIFKLYQSIQFPSQLSLVSCQPYKDTLK